jgi:hypothetical protein
VKHDARRTQGLLAHVACATTCVIVSITALRTQRPGEDKFGLNGC